MRIALVVPGGVDRSGEYRVIPALVALMSRLALRHDVHVFALNQEPLPGEWELAGAHIYNIGPKHTRRRAIASIRRRHSVAPFDLVQAIWSGSCGLIAVVAARTLGIPSLIHVAGGEPVALPEIGFGGRLTWRGRVREALVLRGTSVITAASAPMIATLAELGVEAQRLPLGTDLSIWRPREPTRRDPRRPARLIHVASLNRVKDQPTLLRALASLMETGVDFEMDIVGEDTLQGEIQALAARLQLGARVRFRGFLTQQELRPLVESADLMVISSRHEAGPLVMLEAAVVGVPTVGTAVGHVAEWAPQASMSVPVGDSSELAAAIAGLLQDEELRLSLAREALKRARREDADYTAQCFESLYERVR